MISKKKKFGAAFAGRLWAAVMLIIVIAGCQTATTPPDVAFTEHSDVPAVAVWELDNLNPDAAQSEWGEFFTSALLEVFNESEKVELVEREKLFLALEELQIGSSGLAKEETRLEIGKMIGARQMVFGTYLIVGETLRLDLRMVEVETGRILKAAKRTVSPAGLTESLKQVRSAGRELLTE